MRIQFKSSRTVFDYLDDTDSYISKTGAGATKYTIGVVSHLFPFPGHEVTGSSVAEVNGPFL